MMRTFLRAGAAALAVTGLWLGAAQALPAPVMHPSGQPAQLVEVKNGHGHGNRGRHLGWSRGKHKGLYKQRGYERHWGHHPGRGGPVRAYGGPPGHFR